MFYMVKNSQKAEKEYIITKKLLERFCRKSGFIIFAPRSERNGQ